MTKKIDKYEARLKAAQVAVHKMDRKALEDWCVTLQLSSEDAFDQRDASNSTLKAVIDALTPFQLAGVLERLKPRKP
jgi:hypothetical protein